MKKLYVIGFILILLLTGCSVINLNEASIDTIVNESLFKEKTLYNTNRIGYRYYLPRNLNVALDKDYNEVFSEGSKKYYLYVDIVSYYNKSKLNFIEKENIYYSKYLDNGVSSGYLEITKLEDYFLVELMYNYAKVEVLTKEDNLKSSIVNACNILSSIRFNDTVIKKLVGENKLNFEETNYDIFKPKNAVSNKTFLDYVEEYDGNYSLEVEDSDVIK